MKLGFTGTQRGMTEAQKLALAILLRDYQPTEVHHGDCTGADAEFHAIAREVHSKPRVVVHPPDNDSKRAFCAGDEILPAFPYLARNREIVRDSDGLIAATRNFEEELRSGTWATIRFALKSGVPVHIIWPDGEVCRWER